MWCELSQVPDPHHTHTSELFLDQLTSDRRSHAHLHASVQLFTLMNENALEERMMQ